MNVLKLFHVLFIFIWMGSLLTMTRLIAYQVKESSEIQLRLAKIYRRMYLFVDLPSMILAIALGLWLFFIKEINWKAGWFHMKMTFAFILIVCDVWLGARIHQLCKKPVTGKGIFYKVLHGIAALSLIGALVAIYIFKQRAQA